LKYVIDGDTMTGIADAVREKTGSTATMTPSEIKERIQGLALGGAGGSTETGVGWQRPAAWPDLDALYEQELATGEHDFLYMTYDNTDKSEDRVISLTVSGAEKYTVELGTVTDGVFSAYATESFPEAHDSNSTNSTNPPAITIVGGADDYCRYLTDTDPDFPVVRILSEEITAVTVCEWTETYDPIGGQYGFCVEMAGHLPNLTENPPRFLRLERGRLSGGGQLGSLEEAWAYCYYLQSLDLSGWDTSYVKGMAGAWYGCYSLRSLDLSGWDTSNVTDMAGTWRECYSLQSLDLSGWDTSNVDDLELAWKECYSLQSLDLTEWDISNVDSELLETVFQNCKCLRDLVPPTIGDYFNVSDSPTLSRASLLAILNQLNDEGGLLMLGDINLAKLSSEEKAIAEDKGWALE
jgi:surface protein